MAAPVRNLALSMHAGAALQCRRPSDIKFYALCTQNGKRVVVTGMGIVSCLGNTVEDVKTSLHECKSGIKYNEKYEEIGMKSRVCGRPDLDADTLIDRKQLRFMGNNCKYAFLAMEQAIEDSGLTQEMIASPRTAGILGQGGTSILDIAETLSAVESTKLRRIGPYAAARARVRHMRALPWKMRRALLAGGARVEASACPVMRARMGALCARLRGCAGGGAGVRVCVVACECASAAAVVASVLPCGSVKPRAAACCRVLPRAAACSCRRPMPCVSCASGTA